MNMSIRLYLVISEEEHQAIQKIAKRELRSLREQIRLMLRQELQRLGLLTTDLEQNEEPDQPKDSSLRRLQK